MKAKFGAVLGACVAMTWAGNAMAQEAELPDFSVVLRAGALVTGTGELETDCDGAACPAGSDSDDYDHKGSFLLGADFLWLVGSVVRLGPGIQYGTASEIEPDGSTLDYEVGSDVSVNFVLEAMFPVGETAWLGPRGQIGGLALIPSGDLEDDLDNAKNNCEASNGSGCDDYDGPHAGYNIGVGLGAVFEVSESVRLRADLMIQPYAIQLYKHDFTGVDATITESLKGTRTYLLGGIEF